MTADMGLGRKLELFLLDLATGLRRGELLRKVAALAGIPL